MSTPLAPESFPSDLRPLAAKVRDGVRLSPEDALLCFETPHVLALGRLANAVRRRMHGNTVFYNLNRHIKVEHRGHRDCASGNLLTRLTMGFCARSAV